MAVRLNAVGCRRSESRALTISERRVVQAPTVSASEVALQIADFVIRTEIERLNLFRMHLHTTVRFASPLLLDLAELESISLADAFALITPPENWPRRPVYEFSPGFIRSLPHRQFGLGPKAGSGAWHFRKIFSNPGVAIRSIDHPDGRFGIRPCASVMGFTAAIGPCLLSAFGRTATLKLNETLPATVRISIEGRLLDQVVDHPIFTGRGYVIRRVMEDVIDGTTVINFGANLVPIMLPCYSAVMSKAGVDHTAAINSK